MDGAQAAAVPGGSGLGVASVRMGHPGRVLGV